MTRLPDRQSELRSQRLLIHAATVKDGQLASEVLASGGVISTVCNSVAALQEALLEGAGAVLTVEDALEGQVMDVLRAYVAQEPDWSDLPILVLAGQGADSVIMQRAVQSLPNLVVLERPVRTASLISSVRSALLARGRQYEVSEAQARLRENEQRFKSMFDNHPDGAFIRDLDGSFLSINEAHEYLLGYSLEEFQAMSEERYVVPEFLERTRSAFDGARRGTAQKFHTRKIRKDDTRVDVEVVLFPVVVDGNIVGVHGVARDVTLANHNERRIKYLATHDALTGLANRTMLDDRLHHALEQAKRNDRQIGVLFLDLNRFKQINDSLGHEKGDQLLKIIASRLLGSVREADTVARLGGDEFVIVLEDLESSDAMSAIATAVIDTVEEPIRLENHEVSVSTSVGGSVFPRDAWDANSLLKFADLAMYRAKEQGSGAFRFFDKRMNQHVLERLLTENALRLALQNDELEVYYQPRVNVESEKIVGLEALIRWHHPGRGLVLPSEFIPLAEEIGMITQIGEWVLETACRQSRIWADMGLPPTRISVNISAYQLSSPTFVERIQRVLGASGLNPCDLELEITESSLMKNLEVSCEHLNSLRSQGIFIAMDDFGTGYSSLAHIKQLPIDTLKIDQSFIVNIAEDHNDAAIVSATIALAHHLGLNVVAEGVTDEEQVAFLKAQHCQELQGYLFGKPRPAAQTTELLKSPKSVFATAVL
ncbi:MAG: hypothetical protein CL583_04415 [Alteromonadaceae bacterium]|nr:hypothetical protein [Alteromonadaceae bacterium]